MTLFGSLPSIGAAACLLWGAAAGAQTAPAAATPPDQPAAAKSDDASTRAATTTFYGDTGLWYVPSAEVLAHRRWSVSGYRRGTNYVQGYSNVADFAGTFAVGLGGRTELFGTFLFDTRIDRDSRPLFFSDQTSGGIIDRYPRVNQPWTGDNVGDFYLGAKVNVWSEYRQNPSAIALRGIVKLPTGKQNIGVSTGKPDVLFDFIASKDASGMVDLLGYAGYELRGRPDGFAAPGGAIRWGAGAAFPSRSPIRFFTELNGEVPSGTTVTLTSATLVGVDDSRPLLTSNVDNLTRATAGVTFQAPKGFFIGVALSRSLPHLPRVTTLASDDPFADYWDWQVRIGYHPGVRVYVPPPPPPPPPLPPPPPPPPPAPQNRAPTVKAQCDPCAVETGRNATVTATAQDPDGDPLTYRWTAPSGSLASPAERQTPWTAPQQEGPVPITVTVNDGRGGTAADTVSIQVIRPTPRSYTFEDVHFDFDRYSLRPEATRLLDEAVNALREDPTLRVQIEGHTCNIGTAEYNLALGDRRATAVKDYLVTRGVAADRLNTISYGEEQPKYDNSREETRRLNRRAALVVNLQR